MFLFQHTMKLIDIILPLWGFFFFVLMKYANPNATPTINMTKGTNQYVILTLVFVLSLSSGLKEKR